MGLELAYGAGVLEALMAPVFQRPDLAAPAPAQPCTSGEIQ